MTPVTVAGDTLTFYTDTGGGWNMLFRSTAMRLGIEIDSVEEGGRVFAVADWPAWKAGASIPPPSDSAPPLRGRLAIVEFGGEIASLQDSTDSGFLGGKWWGNRVWTIDYPEGELWLRSPGDLPKHEAHERVPLGFQVDSSGRRTMHFPRIRVEIDGDSLDLLFDTGATMLLADSALRVLRDGRPARRAASFVSAVLFERWQQKHPDWRVISRATSFEADLIEVPVVTIAGQEAGPVWFEKRREGVFESYMSGMMDEVIVGAIGANAFLSFRVTIDYPNSVALFQRP